MSKEAKGVYYIRITNRLNGNTFLASDRGCKSLSEAKRVFKVYYDNANHPSVDCIYDCAIVDKEGNVVYER